MNKALFILGALVLAGTPSLLAMTADGDARRGSDFFQSQGCVNCHVKGSRPGKEPDLGRRLDRDYTRAGSAARMWSHAPVMWAAMGKENISIPQVSSDEAADLFAYFYAARYFEKPGEAQRGKRFLADKRCTECHSIAGVGGNARPPVAKWESRA